MGLCDKDGEMIQISGNAVKGFVMEQVKFIKILYDVWRQLHAEWLSKAAMNFDGICFHDFDIIS